MIEILSNHVNSIRMGPMLLANDTLEVVKSSASIQVEYRQQ